MVARMPRPVSSLPLLGLLLFLSGCCGGYSVVRTTMADHAQLKGASDIVRSPESAVLHYSRLGEPPNSCGSEVKYMEHLWLQIPSLTPGQAYTIGGSGVVAAYTRQQGEQTVRSASIAGRVEIKTQTAEGLKIALTVTITLPSGETVKLDDDYAFHPMAAGKGADVRRVAGREEGWSSCRASNHHGASG
jgi:hypothetical protein